MCGDIPPAWKCPWKHRHVSADPGYDREKCPWCRQAYIQKIERKEFSHAGSTSQFQR
jgi:hypothetical protein